MVAAVGVAALGATVTLTAAGGGDGVPAVAASATASAGLDDQAASDGMLALQPGDLPQRLGRWQSVARTSPRPSPLRDCLSLGDSGRAAPDLPDQATLLTTLPFRAVRGDGVSVAQTYQWTTGHDSETSLRDLLTRVKACASSSALEDATVLTAGSGTSAAQAVVVRESWWIGVVLVEPGDQGLLSTAELGALVDRVHLRMGRDDVKVVGKRWSAQGGPQLPDDAFVVSALPRGSWAADLLDDGHAPCLPSTEFFGSRTTDPRAVPETAGDVEAFQSRGVRNRSGRSGVNQLVARMSDEVGAGTLLRQWRDFIADCAPQEDDAEPAKVLRVRSVEGGYAIDLRVEAARTTPTPNPESSFGPQTAENRTVYLGRAGRTVTVITVTNREDHPELGDSLLSAALVRLRKGTS